MIINSLKLKNFRNYEDLNIKFNEKLNIIIGNNAQGKTNILEAIYYLSITKSNFSINDKNCINKNKLFSKIIGNIKDINGNKQLQILINDNGKKLEINNKEIKRHSEYIGNLKVIIFNPDDVRLIKETPSNRRRFINIEISQLYEKYINILNEYNLVLKQRNEYLKIIKSGKFDEVYFDILNDKLIDLSYEIYKYRIDFINHLNKYISDTFKDISDYEGLSIKYLPNVDINDFSKIKKIMAEKLKSNFEREVFMGNTLIGPHRDDFSFKLDDNDLLIYGSQGQIKMAILALKLAEINVFKDICGEYPVLLLDDLFSELDVEKRNKVINFLNRDIQTIITTTDLKNIDKRLIRKAIIFKIADAKIVETNYKKDVIKNG